MENQNKIITDTPDDNIATKEAPGKIEVIGVRFKNPGKIYYFDPSNEHFQIKDAVIVETARGVEYGTVAMANKEVSSSEIVSPLKKVVRRASAEDSKKLEANKLVEEKAKRVWEEKLPEYKLEMDLVDVEYTFDNTKLLFYFIAEKRIDFRDFVKALAGVFKTRIELRQIGVRDEAKKVGGLGICGRAFCCCSFLNDFDQVSIKMAKEQNLSLNSVKISGTCGRLMCCLRYENDFYEQESKKLPSVDSIVSTPQGNGLVTEVNLVTGMVKVSLDDARDAAPSSFKHCELKVIGKKKRSKKDDDYNDPKLKELEKE